MFSTARWCLYTSAAALLGLACSSSSSKPGKTADDSAAQSSASPNPASASPTADSFSTGPDSQTSSPAADSQGTGAYAADPNGAHLDARRGTARGPAARSEGTGASGDIAASERSPVAGHDEPVKLDDARIVAMTDAANKAEVEQGRLARERAKDPRVRDFAAMMIDHHSEALRDQQQLKVDPEPGADTLNMQREAKQRLDSLRDKKGAEFDRAYLELQVEEHRRLLDKINRELMPAVKDKKVTSYLEDIRTRVESHLAQAQRLQQELGSSSSSSGKSKSQKSDSGSKHEDSSRTTISNERGSAAKVSNPR